MIQDVQIFLRNEKSIGAFSDKPANLHQSVQQKNYCKSDYTTIKNSWVDLKKLKLKIYKIQKIKHIFCMH